MRVDGSRVPALVMEISARAIRRRIAPRDTRARFHPACRTRRDAIALRSAASSRPSARMRTPPRGSRKPATTAAAESFRTSAIFPLRIRIGRCANSIAGIQKCGCSSRSAALPFPIFGLPVRRVSYPPACTNFKNSRIRHRKNVDRKARHIDCMLLEFIVPAKSCRFGATVRAWRLPAGIVTWRGSGAGLGSGARRALRNFSLDRQDCEADTPASPHASADARWPRAAESHPRDSDAAERNARKSLSASSSRLRTCWLYFSTCAIVGQSPGMSVGKPPPTGSIPNAKSLSNSASCESRPSGPLNKFQSNASRCPR